MHKFDLRKLLRLDLYKDRGTREDLVILSNMMKPYINKLMKEHIILNEKILLNDPSIPESLKLKMYLILRSKYDRTRNKQEIGDNESDSADEGNHSRPGNMSALTQAISDLPKNKRIHGRKLVEILTTSNFIDWDLFGNIISPKICGARKLFRLILYKDEGSREELVLLSVIMKPIINKLMKEHVVLNEKLLKTSYFSGYHFKDNLSEYMSW